MLLYMLTMVMSNVLGKPSEILIHDNDDTDSSDMVRMLLVHSSWL